MLGVRSVELRFRNITMRDKCARCGSHEDYWELWVPECQVAVCKKDLEELKDFAIQHGSLELQMKINDLLDGGTGTE
jgi:hypothetical protein